MNIKNKLIPVILFAMATCLALYHYIAFPSIVVFGEGLSPNVYNVDHSLPVHLIFASVGFFIVFIILGILQNRICSFIGSEKIQSEKLTLISNPTDNKI